MQTSRISTARIVLFLLGCIGTRFLLTALAYWWRHSKQLPYMGYVALIPAIGFTIIYLAGWRKTGAEVFGEKIWWNALRPLHALLWFAFAIAAIYRKPHAWAFLFIDTVIGLAAFTWHRLL